MHCCNPAAKHRPPSRQFPVHWKKSGARSPPPCRTDGGARRRSGRCKPPELLNWVAAKPCSAITARPEEYSVMHLTGQIAKHAPEASAARPEWRRRLHAPFRQGRSTFRRPIWQIWIAAGSAVPEPISGSRRKHAICCIWHRETAQRSPLETARTVVTVVAPERVTPQHVCLCVTSRSGPMSASRPTGAVSASFVSTASPAGRRNRLQSAIRHLNRHANNYPVARCMSYRNPHRAE